MAWEFRGRISKSFGEIGKPNQKTSTPCPRLSRCGWLWRDETIALRPQLSLGASNSKEPHSAFDRGPATGTACALQGGGRRSRAMPRMTSSLQQGERMNSGRWTVSRRHPEVTIFSKRASPANPTTEKPLKNGERSVSGPVMRWTWS